MKMVINADVFKSNADLSKAVAFSDGTNAIYWDALTKAQAKEFYDWAINAISKYVGAVGSDLACGILGVLEDTYPEWMEEFESI